MSRKFVKLQQVDNTEAEFNVGHITFMGACQGKKHSTLVRLLGGMDYYVTQSPDEIRALINSEETSSSIDCACCEKPFRTGDICDVCSASPTCAHCGKPFTAGMSCGECGPHRAVDMDLLEAAELLDEKLNKHFPMPIDLSNPYYHHFAAIRNEWHALKVVIQAARAAVEGK